MKENVNNNFLKEQIELYREIRQGNKTWHDMENLREAYGMPSFTIDSLRRGFNALSMYEDAGWTLKDDTGEAPSKRETVETNFETGVTTSDKLISVLPEDINDASALLEAHGFNPNAWELVSAKNSRWNQGMKDEIRVLYSSKISVRPINGITRYLPKILNELKDFKPTARRSTINVSNYNVTEDVLVLPLYDFHWGRLYYLENREFLSLQDTERLLLSNIDEYVAKFAKRRFKEIYLVIGQDYFNSSFTGYTTSQKHEQSNIVDTETMYRTGTEVLIEIIERFIPICEQLNIICTLGNHDQSEEHWLFRVVDAYYRNIDNVIIDCEDKYRKYLDLGASCVGLGHLDKEKDRAFGLMQCEAPHLWAKAKTRMFIAGHLHHFSVESKQGVEVWRVPSPALPDQWTYENGYVQNIPSTMAFVFNKEKGLVETHFVKIY